MDRQPTRRELLGKQIYVRRGGIFCEATIYEIADPYTYRIKFKDDQAILPLAASTAVYWLARTAEFTNKPLERKLFHLNRFKNVFKDKKFKKLANPSCHGSSFEFCWLPKFVATTSLSYRRGELTARDEKLIDDFEGRFLFAIDEEHPKKRARTTGKSAPKEDDVRLKKKARKKQEPAPRKPPPTNVTAPTIAASEAVHTGSPSVSRSAVGNASTAAELHTAPLRTRSPATKIAKPVVTPQGKAPAAALPVASVPVYRPREDPPEQKAMESFATNNEEEEQTSEPSTKGSTKKKRSQRGMRKPRRPSQVAEVVKEDTTTTATPTEEANEAHTNLDGPSRKPPPSPTELYSIFSRKTKTPSMLQGETSDPITDDDSEMLGDKSAKKTSSGAYEMIPLDDSFEPTFLDVIFGRNKEAFKHPGNTRFRAKVQSQLHSYSSSSSKVKSGIVRDITESVRRDSPQGGFVKQIDGKWFDVGERASQEKTRQLFRDLLRSKSSTKAKAKLQSSIGSMAIVAVKPSEDPTVVASTKTPGSFMDVSSLASLGKATPNVGMSSPVDEEEANMEAPTRTPSPVEGVEASFLNAARKRLPSMGLSPRELAPEAFDNRAASGLRTATEGVDGGPSPATAPAAATTEIHTSPPSTQPPAPEAASVVVAPPAAPSAVEEAHADPPTLTTQAATHYKYITAVLRVICRTLLFFSLIFTSHSAICSGAMLMERDDTLMESSQVVDGCSEHSLFHNGKSLAISLLVAVSVCSIALWDS